MRRSRRSTICRKAPVASVTTALGDLERFFKEMTTHYAATDEKHDAAAWEKVAPARRREGRGIEVGHIFYFGTKYTKAMNTTVAGPDGKHVHPEMGSYGIGVSRLVGAVIEASHDEAGIIWPDSIAPFKAAILNLKPATRRAMRCARRFMRSSVRRRPVRRPGGARRRQIRRCRPDGPPWQIVVGPRGAAAGRVELKRRASRRAERAFARRSTGRICLKATHVRTHSNVRSPAAICARARASASSPSSPCSRWSASRSAWPR